MAGETTAAGPLDSSNPPLVASAADAFLHDVWTYYFHDPRDTNWTFESYKRIGDVSTMQDFWGMQAAIQPFLKDSMFFVMREYVYPCWDDPNNLQGGCLSLKVPQSQLGALWLHITQHLHGETLIHRGQFDGQRTPSLDLDAQLNGVSVSPKRSFSIVKLWLRTHHLSDRKCFNIPSTYTSEVLYKANSESIKQDKR